MRIDQIPVGVNPPHDLNVIIEVPLGGVPVDALSLFYSGVSSYRDLPQILIKQIEHFFAHYKDLEEGKWVEIVRWGSAEEAVDKLREAIARHGSGA